MTFERPDRLDDTLYIVCAVFNPVRYRSRIRLYEDFARYVAGAGKARLVTVEVAFGEREFAVTDAANPLHVQLRTTSELWLKENALNLAIQRLPSDARYIAWVDADITFVREDWADETLHQLQHYAFVQMWSQAQDLSPAYETVGEHRGFAWCYWHDEPLPTPPGFYGVRGRRWHWHPGYAWAARCEALDAVGGLMDFAILGSADDHIAKVLIGRAVGSLHGQLSADYKERVGMWQARAERTIRRSVGYVPGLLLHKWHGKKTDRKYRERWSVLTQHTFNPRTDLARDTQGLWSLDTRDDRQRRLRDDLQRYFRQRNEDSLDA